MMVRVVSTGFLGEGVRPGFGGVGIPDVQIGDHWSGGSGVTGGVGGVVGFGEICQRLAGGTRIGFKG